MSSLVPKLPTRVRSKLEESATEGLGFGNIDLEIAVILNEGGYSVRDWAAYLELADRVYGKTFERGLISYALRPSAQLRISEVRKGSTELLVVDSLFNFLRNDASALVFLYLFLKYGPAGLKTISETVKNFTDSYKTYREVEQIDANIEKIRQESKLTKASRKKIEAEMRNDPLLRELDENELSQIRRLLRESAKSEKRLIPSSRRFTIDSVQEIEIRRARRTGRFPNR